MKDVVASDGTLNEKDTFSISPNIRPRVMCVVMLRNVSSCVTKILALQLPSFV